ncbi:MAG: cyclophilin-like fold protein [Leptospirillia bacterium]
MRTIRITCGTVSIRAELLKTPTADAVWEALPCASAARTWGEEVYFPVSINAALEDTAKDVVEAGEIAFWTEGHCIAIGFGPTPISQEGEIRLAARTNVFARALDDVTVLGGATDGAPVVVARAN